MRYAIFVLLLIVAGCSAKKDAQTAAQAFLDDYSKTYMELGYKSSLAVWKSNTHIVEGDDTNALATRAAKEALAAFTGSRENIEKAQEFLKKKEQLDPLQTKQLQNVLLIAAENPQTVPELVKQKIAAETEQVEKLYGFTFEVNGRKLTTNEIDKILRESDNLAERRRVWEASKEVGKGLRPGLIKLQDLRNRTVQALGYSSFAGHQASEYEMTSEAMVELMEKVNRELRPLYRELHTWVRYELAKKYRQPVPDLIPAHWLPNRWGQDWNALVKVAGLDLDAALKDKEPRWIVEQAEEFYVSLGFGKLPAGFWEKSSLYPLPKDAAYKKNNHASAWHLDLENDVRSLMSVESNFDWYGTVHHELGHVYYFLSYTRPEVPPLLRGGANRAFHEGIGSLMGLAATQKAFLEGRGLVAKGTPTDEIQALLKGALADVVFIPFSTGTMTHFEHALYEENLPAEKFNQYWWELAGTYQGIAPPSERGEEYCDAATKTHINNDPAQYYDYPLSSLFFYQVHETIATKILKQDPHNTNYWGHPEVGKFLADLMRPGATRNWRELLKEKTGKDLSAEAMLKYYSPLLEYLKKQNWGRKHTLPQL